jgi:molybdopterin converting factor subunit 1
VPIIIETPDAETMHAVNLARLQRLARGEPPQIGVTVRLFGPYKDYAPDEMRVELPIGSTVGEVASLLAAREPRLAGIEQVCRPAVNEEYTSNSQEVRNSDTVAFIPPMSGG